MIFTIHAEKSSGDRQIFTYDNMTNYLAREDGTVFAYPDKVADNSNVVTKISKQSPGVKSKQIGMIKIQLGLSCNYSCDYCSQKFVERPKPTSKNDIDAFMEKLEQLEFSEEHGLKIEMWGGEPFIYWQAIKGLTIALQEKFTSWKVKPRFSVITNGSLLTDEITDFLMEHDYAVSISHDGPGQFVRGPDPFDDPAQKKIILDFYRAMKRLGKNISFNSMLSKRNMSRRQIADWFIELTGDPEIAIGEGNLVDSYDADAIQNSLQTKAEHFEFRQQAFAEIYESGGNINFNLQLQKINNFTDDVLAHKHADTLGQKCGMDSENVLAVDLKGNVITCQNVSAVETAMNGESHKIGTLDDYENICLNTATHWSNRKECGGCPVLHLCKGACMFLEEKYWETSCANAYSDNLASFALSFEKITGGYIPIEIKADGLPLDRQDVFGTLYSHEEKELRKIIPIKIVSDVVEKVDGVEIYGKARVAA